MPYATLADLNEKFGEDYVLRCFDRDGEGTIDTAASDKALADATAKINSYVSVRYELPLASTPEVIKQVCCDIAVYVGSPDTASVTEEKRKRYDDAISWLKDLSRGLATLGFSADEEPAEANTVDTVLSTTSPVRLFTRALMGGVL